MDKSLGIGLNKSGKTIMQLNPDSDKTTTPGTTTPGTTTPRTTTLGIITPRVTTP